MEKSTKSKGSIELRKEALKVWKQLPESNRPTWEQFKRLPVKEQLITALASAIVKDWLDINETPTEG